MRLKRQRIDLDGGPASYLALGPQTGIPVVLIHGFLGDLLTWQFVCPQLARQRRVVAIDLPGHGRSTLDTGDGSLNYLADWLWQVLDRLELGRVHLVGLSMGGKVALLAAQAAPDRIESLSLIACAGIAPGVDIALLRRTLNARTHEDAKTCLGLLFADPAGPADTSLLDNLARGLLARTAGNIPTAPLWTILERSFANGDHWAPVEWAALPYRHQVIWGDADRLVPLPAPVLLPPPARLHLLPGVGHMPQVETPTRLAQLLDAFFDVPRME